MSAACISFLGCRTPLTIGAQWTNRWAPSPHIDESTVTNLAVPLANLPDDELRVFVHRKTVLPSASHYTMVRGDSQGLERIKTAFVQEEIKRNPLVAKHPMRLFSDQMSEPLRSTADLERASVKANGREVHLYYRLDTGRSVDAVQSIQASVQKMQPAPLSRQQREMVESASRAREKAMYISAAITAPVHAVAPVSWKQTVCDNIGAFVQVNPQCSDVALHNHAVGELMTHSDKWAPVALSGASHMVEHTPSTVAGMAAVDLVHTVRSLDMARVGSDPRDVRRAYSRRLERSHAWHGLEYVARADPRHRLSRHHQRHYHVRHGKHDLHAYVLQRGPASQQSSMATMGNGEMAGVRDHVPGGYAPIDRADRDYRRAQPRRVQSELKSAATTPSAASVASIECRGIANKNKKTKKDAAAAAAAPSGPAQLMAEIENDDSHLQRTAGVYRPLTETDMIGKRMWGSRAKGHKWALNEGGLPTHQHINGPRAWYAKKKAQRRAKKQAKLDAAAQAAAQAQAQTQASAPSANMMNVEGSRSRSRSRSPPRDDSGQWKKVQGGVAPSSSTKPVEGYRSRSRSRSPPRNDSGQWKKVQGEAGAAAKPVQAAHSGDSHSASPSHDDPGLWWKKIQATAATASSAETSTPPPSAADYELQPIEKNMASSSSLSKKLHVGIRNAAPSTRADLKSQTPLPAPQAQTQARMNKPAGTTLPTQAAPKQPAQTQAHMSKHTPSTMKKPEEQQQQQQQPDAIEARLTTGPSEFNLRVTNHATMRRNINGEGGVAPPIYKNFGTVVEVGYYVALPLGISRAGLPKGPWVRVGLVNAGDIKTFRLKTGPAYTFVFVDKFDGDILNVVPFQDQRSGDYTITVHGKDDGSKITFRPFTPASLTAKGTAFLRQRLPKGVNGSILANGHEYKLTEEYTQVPVGIHTLRCSFDDPTRAAITSQNSVILSEDTRYALKNVGSSVLVRVEDDFGPEKLAKYAPNVKPVANSIVFVNPVSAEAEFAPIDHFMPKKQGSSSQYTDDDYNITTNKGTQYPINPSHAHIWDMNDDKVPVLATFAHPADQSCTVLVVGPAKLLTKQQQ